MGPGAAHLPPSATLRSPGNRAQRRRSLRNRNSVGRVLSYPRIENALEWGLIRIDHGVRGLLIDHAFYAVYLGRW